jgi:carbonic anhydrase/acetyltransferase-like protein (isoleucine patch superfamily)
VVEPVKIKADPIVGIKATVMGEVEIGEGTMVGPHEVVMPKARMAAVER